MGGRTLTRPGVRGAGQVWLVSAVAGVFLAIVEWTNARPGPVPRGRVILEVVYIVGAALAVAPGLACLRSARRAPAVTRRLVALLWATGAAMVAVTAAGVAVLALTGALTNHAGGLAIPLFGAAWAMLPFYQGRPGPYAEAAPPDHGRGA
jgi:hypothetical protein